MEKTGKHVHRSASRYLLLNTRQGTSERVKIVGTLVMNDQRLLLVKVLPAAGRSR